MPRSLVLTVWAAAGCGHNAAPLDAGDCWPMSSSTPGGTIELGTDGSFVEPNVIESRFLESLSPADLDGQQVRVQAEVIDANGLYASDEKIVTVHVPQQ